jgi:hypothetical protein
MSRLRVTETANAGRLRAGSRAFVGRLPTLVTETGLESEGPSPGAWRQPKTGPRECGYSVGRGARAEVRAEPAAHFAPRRPVSTARPSAAPWPGRSSP